MMENIAVRENAFGLLGSAGVEMGGPYIPEFMTAIPHINESLPSPSLGSSITASHGGQDPRDTASVNGQEGQDMGLQPLLDLEQQQARHQAPTPAGSRAGGTAGEPAAGAGQGQQGEPYPQHPALRQGYRTATSPHELTTLNGPTPQEPGGKLLPLSPPAPHSLKHHGTNSGVEYPWMKEKKPSRKHLRENAASTTPIIHPSHAAPPMPPQHTALNGLGEYRNLYLYPHSLY